MLWASPLLLGTQGGSWQGDQMEGSGPGLQGGASTPASEDLGLRAVNQHWGVQPGKSPVPTAVPGRAGLKPSQKDALHTESPGKPGKAAMASENEACASSR